MSLPRPLCLCVALAGACLAAVHPQPFLSEPALSPDGKEIAFVSGGDIWSVPARGGEARLLVSHQATEARPLYSPDGTELAFTSDRSGAMNIYVLTFATGAIRRLTYSDVDDALSAWSPDGKWLYFDSTANDIVHQADVFRVPSQGGTALEVTRERFFTEMQAVPSPDGSKLAFVAKRCGLNQFWRHGHSHIDETEIWTKGVADKEPFQRVIHAQAKQLWPMWDRDGSALYYDSDEGGTENIYRQAVSGEAKAKQLSHFTDGRLLYPSLGADGREMVFERDMAIWKMDTRSGHASPVEISLRGSAANPMAAHRTFSNFEELALSPDGKKIALIGHGEVFAALSSDGGEAQRLTQTVAAESDAQWSPDSNRVLYVSTRNRHGQLFEYDLTKNAEQQLTASDRDDSSPAYSPDGKQVAFVRDEKTLHVLTLDGKADRELVTDDLEEPVLRWSPDSKMIAYTAVGAKSFRNIHVVAVSDKVTHAVSFLANGETATTIAWSPDGKYLLFDTAQRTEPSQMARVDLVPHIPAFREDQFRDLFKVKENVPDTPKTPPPAPDRPAPASTEKKPAESGSKTSDDAKKPAETRVVFEGIHNRLTLMPIGLDVHYPVISPDGKTLLFAAQSGMQTNLYTYDLDEQAKEPPTARQLTSTPSRKSHWLFNSDSKSVLYLDNGTVQSITIESRVPKPVAVSAAIDVEFDSEKLAVFDQAWDVLNRRFYDPKFHGRDWAGLHDTFAAYVAGSATPTEGREVINRMIGELNASHSGISGPRGESHALPVGRLGLRFNREAYEAGSGLVVREIVPLGPAALEGSIKLGDVLLRIDGQELTVHTNLDRLLNDKVGHRLALRVKSGPTERDVVLKPISTSTEAGLLYRAWIDANRALVDHVTNGQLGYIHIADMSEASLRQLYIDLDVSNQEKRGVIIDLRNNFGGFVNEYALDVFTRKNYLTMTPRGGQAAPARPMLGQRALGLPTVLVTDQGSLSDAEDFTEGYRTLHLGKVVGEPTAGWIIYTGGTQLVDGSLLRIPFIRVEDHNGNNMEGHPRPVDKFVERTPGEWSKGIDKQLESAAALLLGEMTNGYPGRVEPSGN